MTLKLVMIRCPDNVAPEQRAVQGGEFNIGRGPDNEWIIADPDRHLSKRHCRLAFRAGAWELSDLSSNGTFLNRASTPIGAGEARVLRSGDRIGFGAYEIEVAIEEEAAAFDRQAPHAGYSPRAPNDLDPFAAPAVYVAPSGFGNQDDMRLPDDIRFSAAGSSLDAGNSPILPADFNPLAPPEEPFKGPTQSDHAPAIDSAFRPPAPVALIPDDWDVDPPAPTARPGVSPQRAQSMTMSPKLDAPRPNTSWSNTSQAGTAAPGIPQAAISPAELPASEVHIPTMPVQASPAPVVQPRQGHDAVLAAAFLRGLGFDNATLSDPEKALEQIGAAMRATVNGIRQTLMARASIKDEFRIEQTMIRASGNNPLKFSVDDDDAIATLIGVGRRSSVTPEEAITEAFRDVRMHELATISAMQAAVRVLLAQFDPAVIERKAGSNALNILPAQRKARAWEAFTQLHQNVTQALSDDFDSVFGKAFARAYEQAIDELTARGTSP